MAIGKGRQEMKWYFALNLAGLLLSALVLNPVPIGATLAATVVAFVIEQPQQAAVSAAGRSADLPTPDSAAGCGAFLVSLVAWALVALIIVGTVGVLIMGGLGA
jgi:hypothetical protein